MSKALTLSGLMALLLPKERLFVIHHLGADISEAVAGGTVEELERTRCVEVCGNNIVERDRRLTWTTGRTLRPRSSSSPSAER